MIQFLKKWEAHIKVAIAILLGFAVAMFFLTAVLWLPIVDPYMRSAFLYGSDRPLIGWTLVVFSLVGIVFQSYRLYKICSKTV